MREKTESTKYRKIAVRLLLFLLGTFLVALGIDCCAICGLGISPVSSIPYMLTFVVPLSFGTLTMLFHIVNIGFQYILERKWLNIRVFMQLPVAAALGILIDLIKAQMDFSMENLIKQVLFLLLGIVFTAAGMFLMLEMNLAQNPPDGTVALISKKTGIELGTVKILYDTSMTVVSVLTGWLLTKHIIGFGIGTVASAILVGRVLTWMRRKVRLESGNLLERI